MRQERLTIEQDDRIVKLYDEEGLTFAVIGERFGRIVSTIAKAYHRRKKELVEEKKDEI